MPRVRSVLTALVLASTVVVVISCARPVFAQGGIADPGNSPQDSAPIDITGYWQSLIVDDFRFRVTPQKGDIEYLPLTPEAQRIAMEWDPDRDLANGDECRAYGAVGVMQQPGRLHISWEDEWTIRIDADSGSQTRRLRFGPKPSEMPEASLQGYSEASWLSSGRGGRGSAPSSGGELRAITTNMRPGYLRKNGVPYSADAVYTEHFYLLPGPGGEPFLTVTTSVSDPANLTQPFIYAYHFKRQDDATGWAPTPCWNR